MSFYDKLQLPLNEEEPVFEFVNAVTVSDKFAEATVMNAQISKELEKAAEELSDVEINLELNKRAMGRLRRQIFSQNYGKITKSADKEIQEAFLLTHAGDLLEELARLEEEEELLWKRRGQLKTTHDKWKNRLWSLERMTTYLTEWLNNDKFRTRIQDARLSAA